LSLPRSQSIFRLRKAQHTSDAILLDSRLYDQDTFYRAFIDDLKRAKTQVIIESPFITTKRMSTLLPIFRALTKRSVQLVINTKPLDEHESEYEWQAEQAITELQQLGAIVLFTGGHHRKLAIIDKSILYEGSLNILSQNDSCEIMRRVYSEQLANQMLAFLHLEKFID
jgi:phosphatidylserine/phosphatidylglycerophosphate/cardiolipin synthase-like enzyme